LNKIYSISHNKLHFKHPIKLLLITISIYLVMNASSINAATFTVLNTNDAGTGSLREAIGFVNSAPGANTVNFIDTLDGQTIILTSGQIDITSAASTNVDASTLATGITVSGNNTSRIFGETIGQQLTINNLTLTNGITTGNTPDNSSSSLNCSNSGIGTFSRGGAICTVGSLVLIDTIIFNNSTLGEHAYGGGFYTFGDSQLINSTVYSNSTLGYNSNGGGFYSNGNTTLNNSLVDNNNTSGRFADGGGFSARNVATLNNSTVSGNSTTNDHSNGGGFTASLRAILTNSIVSGNFTTAYGSDGGGFESTGNNTIITNSIISGNSTRGFSAHGGGFVVYTQTTLINCTVFGNSTSGHLSEGGGFDANDDMTLINSTVSGNSTGGDNANGGGISAHNNTMLSNSTISDNNTTGENSQGDGIIVRDDLTLNSTIVSGNGTNNFTTSIGDLINASNSLLGDPEVEITGINTNNIFDNSPLLAPLADNGCAIMAGVSGMQACVQTNALQNNSPALDTGIANGLVFDQRGEGYYRQENGQTDIGAFEHSIYIMFNDGFENL